MSKWTNLTEAMQSALIEIHKMEYCIESPLYRSVLYQPTLRALVARGLVDQNVDGTITVSKQGLTVIPDGVITYPLNKLMFSTNNATDAPASPPAAEDGVGEPCNHEDAVRWNPYNYVVQCHRCGEIYIRISDVKVIEAERDEAKRQLEGKRDHVQDLMLRQGKHASERDGLQRQLAEARAEVARLREACEPFVETWKQWLDSDGYTSNEEPFIDWLQAICDSELLQANWQQLAKAAALAKAKGEDEAMGTDLTTARKRVIFIMQTQLSDMLEDYLAENIGEDVLSAYHDGFTVSEVATDLSEAIKQWANGYTIEALTELVADCADNYLDDAEE